MRQPEMYTAQHLNQRPDSKQNSSGDWVPARPEGSRIWPWTWRWKLAFDVLTGKCDVVNWEDS